MKKFKPQFIFKYFLIWRISIILISFIAVKLVPIYSRNFFGGGLTNYSNNPFFWGNINFDGEHYLSLAQNGYQPLTYFFFPLFPKLINILSFTKSQLNLALTGLIISNLSIFIALIGIYKLVKIDFKDNIAKLTIIFFLIFPTSFYFGTYYTESLFLALIIWSFYFARQKNFLFASILAAFASATRLIGIAMLPVLLIEYFLQNKKISKSNFLPLISIFLSVSGLVLYMYYLFQKTGDPLIFFHQVSIYGDQRSQTLIFLPQVFYRYIFEIFPNISFLFFPVVFTTLLEFFISLTFIILILFGISRLRLSYSIYSIIAFFIPTLSGSFSSMPRYVLAIFPVYILMSLLVEKLPKSYKISILFVMLILMTIATSMFWRGYWVS